MLAHHGHCRYARRWPAERLLQSTAVPSIAVLNLTEIIQTIGDPSGDLQYELRSLLLETDPDRVPHVSELAVVHNQLAGEPTKH
ncbi:MAG: hypothetical protein U0527_17900 [Candidatus Eisenbacteria bacterium]